MTAHYTRVVWNHQNGYDPIEIYSELDEVRWEIRRVERFRGGALGYTSRAGSLGGTFLSPETFSPLAEIIANPEFEAADIGKDAFEEVWSKATRNAD